MCRLPVKLGFMEGWPCCETPVPWPISVRLALLGAMVCAARSQAQTSLGCRDGNRVLRDLREQGIVELHYRRLSILNPDRLIEVAETDPHLLMNWMNPGAASDETAGRANTSHLPDDGNWSNLSNPGMSSRSVPI